MEKIAALLNTSNGISGLLASLCVLLSLQIVIKVGDFLWKLQKEKFQISEETVKKLSSSMEQNTKAISYLEGRLKSLEHTILKIADTEEFI